MSNKKNKLKTLSEKLADSFAPQELRDPEVDSDEETAPKVVDFDEEDEEDYEFARPESSRAGLSDFRKRNVKLLSDHSEKYRGKVSSRKELEDDDDDNDQEDDEEDIDEEEEDEDIPYESDDSADSDDALEEYRKQLKNCKISKAVDDRDESLGTDEEEDDSDMEAAGGNAAAGVAGEEDSDYDSNLEEGDFEEEDDESDDDTDDEEDTEEQNILTEQNKNTEIRKGAAVQNQLKIWEKLLELRIHSQKMMNKANSLPLPLQYDKLSDEDEGFSNLSKETSTNVENLLEKMLDLQRALLQQNTETKSILKASRKRLATTTAQEGPVSKRYASTLVEDFEQFQPYRNSVLLKWDDRMKLLTPGAGAKKKSIMDEFDVLKKIDNILLNKSELIEKSQKPKGGYRLFGQKTEVDVVDEPEPAYGDVTASTSSAALESSITCPDIYDDTDFYHQQLRELIEFKTNTSANSAEITKQFAELQKLRQKMKKKVDTRASKGRKIRYVVHNKLVNFMAPNESSNWTDESKSELYRSLFAT